MNFHNCDHTSKPPRRFTTVDFTQNTLYVYFQDNQTLAGVVGIDIPVSRFEAFAPRSHLGPFGYPFAINTNGFLIFHPNLWMIANYLEDPAHNVRK